jgi:WD40 repeat protein
MLCMFLYLCWEMLSLVGELKGHTEERVWHAAWSPNGSFLASCGEDRVIRIWSAANDDWENTSQIRCIALLEEAQSRTIRYLFDLVLKEIIIFFEVLFMES